MASKSLREFYKDKEIFITGGSGFIGKLLIEKLLRSCPEIACIYMLLRPKRGKSTASRLKVFLEEHIFDRIRDEYGEQMLSKVHAIEGDSSQLRIGLSDESIERLKNVSIIVHSAATVRFDEPLRDSIIQNTRGTLELLKLAENLKNLHAFVHVSTAYSNPDKYHVEERLYEAPADWRMTIKLAETYADSSVLDVFTTKYTEKHPNTYTFAKSLAEQVVNDYRHKVPVIILRPSVVITANKEPEPGWIENFNGPAGLTYAMGFGFVSAGYLNEQTGIDMIPIDVVVRSIILTAYKRGQLFVQQMNDTTQAMPLKSYSFWTKRNANNDTQTTSTTTTATSLTATPTNQSALDDATTGSGIVATTNKPTSDDCVEVMNCAAGKYHTISNRMYQNVGTECAIENPFDWAIWTPTARLTTCYYWYCLQVLLLDIPRAFLIDLLLKAIKRKPFALTAQRRLFSTNVVLYYFTSRLFLFDVERCLSLNKLLHDPKEFEDFNINDLVDYDFKHLFSSAIRMVKKLKMNAPSEPSQGAKIRVRLYFALTKLAHIISIALISRYVWRLLWARFNRLNII